LAERKTFIQSNLGHYRCRVIASVDDRLMSVHGANEVRFIVTNTDDRNSHRLQVERKDQGQ